jgi:hypothetical protein
MADLADDVLAKCRVDDHTPISPEWLNKLPRESADQYVWHMAVFAIPKERRTRGHYRAFCEVLGLPTGEGK